MFIASVDDIFPTPPQGCVFTRSIYNFFSLAAGISRRKVQIKGYHCCQGNVLGNFL